MHTTVLNPTIWLLAALAASSVVAAIRGQSARLAFGRVLQAAARIPLLLALGLAAIGGLGSRLVLGYLAPGNYAEEVLAARSFLSARQLYHGDDRRDFSTWLSEEPAPISPWTLPGLTVCQASAVESRPQFYTAQGHSPVLLMASVPIVAVGGGRALYVIVSLGSLVSLVGIAFALGTAAGVPPRSTTAAILLLALAGWQPALAGVRQGDAVIIVSGLVVAAWTLLRTGDDLKGGFAAGLAGMLLPPAMVLLIPVGLRSRRALTAGLGTLTLGAGVTVAAAGPLVFADYARSTLATARLYASSPMAYSALGQLLRLDPQSLAPVVWAALAALVVTIALALRRGGRARDNAHSMPRDAERFDITMAMFAALAFLLVPVAWSQHASLLVVPLAVLLGRTLSIDRPWTLAIWAALALLISLPDNAAVRLGLALKLTTDMTRMAVLPPAPVWAAAGLWAWLLAASVRTLRPEPRVSTPWP
jgi:Glycosyltransferase family 87